MSEKKWIERSVKKSVAQDSPFHEIENIGLPQHIAGIAIYDRTSLPGGSVQTKKILAHLESVLRSYPLFRSKLLNASASLNWPLLIIDEKFDVELHVQRLRLPKPGDWHQLSNLISRVSAKPLELNRPLWELTIIDGVDSVKSLPYGSVALLIRIHNELMDGEVGREMMTAIYEFAPDAEFIHPPKCD